MRTDAPPSSESSPRDDRVLHITRVLAAVIVPFLIAAFGMLYLLPGRSGEIFAWPVNPTITAMMLGAAYMGGAYFFTRVVFARQWHTIALGLIPVSAFAGYLGVATFLHWDRFTPGHISFILWVILYTTLPFVIAFVWYLNRRTDPMIPDTKYRPIPVGARRAVGAMGILLTVVSVMLFVVPEVMIPTWPWTLTPLTSRVMAAMFVLPGLVGINVALDGRWSATRYILQAQMGSIALILLAIIIACADLNWSQWAAWTFTGGMSLLGIALFALYLWMERPVGSNTEEAEG